MRYLVYCSFDGTGYVGWQKQSKGISVQSSVEEALGIFFQQKIEIVGCGRTDAGVHGRNYAFHFNSDLEFEIDQFIYKANKLLPPLIAIISADKVSDIFHARFSADSRAYIYRIHVKKDPFKVNNSWYNAKLGIDDLPQLNEVANFIASLDDFSSFSKTGSDNTNNRCRMIQCEWKYVDDQLELHIQANRFLRGMVRLIVGACINVVKGKIGIDIFKQRALEGKILPHALSAPAQGLTFEKVVFE